MSLTSLMRQPTRAQVAGMTLKDLHDYIAIQRAERGLPKYMTEAEQVAQAAWRLREADSGDAPPDMLRLLESASISDFPNLLGNNLYRRVQNWYDHYEQVWMQYAYVQEHVDYRPVVYGFLAEMEDADQIEEEKDYRDSPYGDKGYSLSLQKWGKQITLPFKVIENDDKGVVGQLPDKMMRSMDRTTQKLVVRSTLEANVAAYDGTALFAAGRSNLVTGAGSAFSMANLQAAITYVQTSTGDADLNPSGAPINAQPRYLVIPSNLMFAAFQALHSAQIVAAGTAGTVTQLGNINPLADNRASQFYTPVTPLVERYLTNTTAWYVLPEPRFSPITVAVRQGRRLRPRVWVNVPFRRQLVGGGEEPYLLSVDDQTYGYSLDISATVGYPYASIKYAGA
jgi:hypothetical protein